ncbi:MAG: septum formation initiator family protein [Bacteroidetes bacterium]|nr:septum formation initiator family protein [Bacteroidota bacterium]MBL7103365.1 septum formation initiator family protein [Bacteroidales bacterium]
MFAKIPSFLKNRYVIAILAFIVWMMFFDRNNFINQFRLVSTLKGLNKQKQYYLKEINNDSIALHRLKTDTDSLEKFAREKYLMKRDDEDIFLIVDEKD